MALYNQCTHLSALISMIYYQKSPFRLRIHLLFLPFLLCSVVSPILQHYITLYADPSLTWHSMTYHSWSHASTGSHVAGNIRLAFSDLQSSLYLPCFNCKSAADNEKPYKASFVVVYFVLLIRRIFGILLKLHPNTAACDSTPTASEGMNRALHKTEHYRKNKLHKDYDE